MNQLKQVAQTANYNCEGSPDSSYGASAYGTCATSVTPGAPNTGFFGGLVESGSMSIILPLVLAIVIVAAAMITMHRKKKAQS